ncbi:hypothetical protein [cyanobacterium endosymbiont of Rhopalodia gibberula]|uniref:hypothetical protein n=1 Tax=cyanobacterium endosymbiont of Rhopalodia gibberula TaxID=1763363 RepID=UPI001559C382|nr:hypothetical protein [cyanobacterium endosymbiont of Rhopalodia gibberula]
MIKYCDCYRQLQHQELIDFVTIIFQHKLDYPKGLVFLKLLENSQDWQNITDQLI